MNTIGAIAFHGDDYGIILCEDCVRIVSDNNSGVEWQVLYEMESESDTPMHCENCEAFMRNRLTRDGVAYVLEQHETNPSSVTLEWVEYYRSEGYLVG